MQRQASSNIASHSCGLSIRTVTWKLIFLFAPPVPAASAPPRPMPLDSPEPRWPPLPNAATTAGGRAVDRLPFLEKQRAAVLGESQVGNTPAETTPHASRAIVIVAH